MCTLIEFQVEIINLNKEENIENRRRYAFHRRIIYLFQQYFFESYLLFKKYC